MRLTTRISNIFKAFANNFLSRFEQPEIMVDQYILNMEEELGKIKDRTAETMVVAKQCQQRYEHCIKELEEITVLKNKAMAAGNEEDIAVLSAKEVELTQASECYLQDVIAAKNNQDEMQNMHNELVAKLQDYKNKRNIFKSRLSVARTYEYMAKAQSGYGTISDCTAGFIEMEDKLDRMMLKSSALIELSKPSDRISELKDKYSKVPAIEATA